MKHLLSLLAFAFTFNAFAQVEGPDATSEDSTFSIFEVELEQRPIWPGCESLTSKAARFECFKLGMLNFVGNNFSVPTAKTKKQKEARSGKVFVSFVIEKDGNVTNVKILRSVHPEVDAEAIRVVKSIPTMHTPGLIDGKSVRLSYILPINVQY
jgi:protein TonB